MPPSAGATSPPSSTALTPDVDWTVNGRRKDFRAFGSWKGPAEVQKFFKAWPSIEEFRVFTATNSSPPRIGSSCSATTPGRSARPASTVASDWVHIFTIRDGKVIKFREFNDTAQFAEAYRG